MYKKKTSFAPAVHCSMKKPFFCLCALKPQTLRMNEEDPLHTSEESSQKYKGGEKKKKRLLCSFLFPPLSLFPTLPKVLLGNRSQVFDKPVVDMTAVQSSV